MGEVSSAVGTGWSGGWAGERGRARERQSERLREREKEREREKDIWKNPACGGISHGGGDAVQSIWQLGACLPKVHPPASGTNQRVLIIRPYSSGRAHQTGGGGCYCCCCCGSYLRQIQPMSTADLRKGRCEKREEVLLHQRLLAASRPVWLGCVAAASSCLSGVHGGVLCLACGGQSRRCQRVACVYGRCGLCGLVGFAHVPFRLLPPREVLPLVLAGGFFPSFLSFLSSYLFLPSTFPITYLTLGISLRYLTSKYLTYFHHHHLLLLLPSPLSLLLP
ncbi:hypothetical protein GGS23DRAFT_46528 [Durotheca rogersii]|uniref:uncharacterized protein n=1 Tax=Durotheca rogersii TaxID=419775 RepID=UPI00221FAB0C|nr:uncharacterized protein GGS23DRAFT_46528 [Durotheca rogersii]KAI5868701.1 hypothetical protein GGS23DRAFT_46528 [Durotheca rogersii]